MIVFRQLQDLASSTYSYLLADPSSREAVLIDPVFEQVRREVALIKELGLTLRYTIDTHVHADHVTGAWLLRQRLGSRIAIAQQSGAEGADLYLRDEEPVIFGCRSLTAIATPGHTVGCITLVLDDRTMAFTGDALLIRGCGRTDFQAGDPEQLYRSVRQRIFSLPDDCLLYPGHDYKGSTVTTVAEERQYNPRLGGEIGEQDFAGHMRNLALPHPMKLDIAVPANLFCGKPAGDAHLTTEPDWAPLTYTYAGIWEVHAQWLEEHVSAVQLVDVREAEEFDGVLGHIASARLIPLGELPARLGDLDRGKPIVTVCRSGSRSARAAVILEQAGFTKVANLSGGMLRWRLLRLPTDAAGSAAAP